MSTQELARRFEEERARLRAVAFRIVGSEADADDVVQDAWLRLARTDAAAVDNLAAWLTTTVGHLALNVLRTRHRHPAQPFDDLPEPGAADAGPEDEAVLGDTVRLALLAVLDTLAPAERVAFVLHDVFGLPFAAVAAILDRSVPATRQLASRARRRVRPAPPDAGGAARRGHAVVDAFFAAGRRGDLQGLLDVLHPDVQLRVEAAPGVLPLRVTGAAAVAARARSFGDPGARLDRVDVAGLPGVLVHRTDGSVMTMVFTVAGDTIVAIDVQPSG